MTEDIFQGYKGDALEILKKYQVRVWGTTKLKPPAVLLKEQFFPGLKMMMISILL